MTLVIGLDTGGTYTDAALLDTATGTVVSSKPVAPAAANIVRNISG